MDLDENAIGTILKQVLYEFPIREIGFEMPRWVTMLGQEHWLQQDIYEAVRQYAEKVTKIRDLGKAGGIESEFVTRSAVKQVDLGSGVARIEVVLLPEIFYRVLGETTGLEICDEASLMPCVINLTRIKKEYEKIKDAMDPVSYTHLD